MATIKTIRIADQDIEATAGFLNSIRQEMNNQFREADHRLQKLKQTLRPLCRECIRQEYCWNYHMIEMTLTDSADGIVCLSQLKD
jgi:hypothetical protein